jgi:HK97 family phage major capsid protein
MLSVLLLALAALLVVWLALEPLAHRAPAALRSRRAFRLARALHMPAAIRFAFMPIMAGADGALDDVTLTEGEKAQQKQISDAVDKLQGDLVKRLGEIKGKSGEDKLEVERREAELAGKVDELIGLAKKDKSEAQTAFETELKERLSVAEKGLRELSEAPVRQPKGAAGSHPSLKDRYDGNYFYDLKRAQKDHNVSDQIREYEEKFRSVERQKAWAIGDLEAADLVLPDIQQALPFLRAQTAVVNLCRELRTSSPAVEFPVYKTGLSVGHVEPGEPKPASVPTFDLEVARVFTIAGLSEVPNQTLEDFPAARGWISTELGAATGAQEEVDVISGDGTGEPLGLLNNSAIPVRKADTTEGASNGRNLISSIFRAAQEIRTKGFKEPTDVAMNPAAWTDIVLSFEANIGFLYGPPQMGGAQDGAPLNQPPARIMGLPVTWSSYIPTAWGKETKKTPIIVGNFQDAIVLRRAPFRIDIDTSVGFKTNMTVFRGEERMGFIVVRPKSFVIISEYAATA